MTQENRGTDTYLRCREAEKTHVCAQCGGNLTTIYNSASQQHVMRCGNNPEHKGAKRRLTDTEIVKRGELDAERGDGTQANLEKYWQEMPSANPLLPRSDVATGTALLPVQLQTLVTFAESVNLKAYLGHVCLYHGKPYVTIDGYYYLKNAMGLPFAVLTDPMTPEQRTAYMVPEGSHAFIATAITRGGDVLGRGIGIVTLAEMEEKSKKNPDHFAAPIVHNKPQIMAEKRAEWQLMQKMIPLGVQVILQKTEVANTCSNPEQAEKDIKELWE